MTTKDTLESLRDRPIFICGHPKSGTSLVRSILDSHPQLIVYPEETVFFRRYLPQAQGLDLQGQLALAEEQLIHIFTWNKDAPPPSQAGYPDRDYSSVSFAQVRQALESIVRPSYRHPGDILSGTILAYGQVSGQISAQTCAWVEKSPYNEYYAGQIFSWWPEARCIHVLRDPRDNYTSYRRKHPDWQPEFFAANWARSTRAGMQNQERYGAGRYLLLRYEDLVGSPKANIEALADFLGIERDPAMTSPTRAGEPWIGNSMFAVEFSGISAAPINRWKNDLALQDAAVIEIMTAPVLRELGGHAERGRHKAGGRHKASPYYEIQVANRDLKAALAARWRVFSWPVRKRLLRRQKTGTNP